MQRYVARGAVLACFLVLAVLFFGYTGPLKAAQTTTVAERAINMTAVQVRGEMVVSVAATGFPGNQELIVTLDDLGAEDDLRVTTGRTNAQGTAIFSFIMPDSWPDGTPISGNAVLVAVSTPSGSLEQEATLYFTSEPVTDGTAATDDTRTPTPAARTRRSINMTASRVNGDMVVTVSAAGFPVDQELVVTLDDPEGTSELEVASGVTNSQGEATFSFVLPTTWPDGTAVPDDAVEVTVGTPSGSVRQSATLRFTTRSNATPTARAQGRVVFPAFEMTASTFRGQMVVALSAEGFPVDRELVVTLENPETAEEMVVATGTTNSQGEETLLFTLPENWPSGAPVEENRIPVTVGTAGGAVKQTATLRLVRR